MLFLNYLMYFEYLKKDNNYEVEEEVEANRKKQIKIIKPKEKSNTFPFNHEFLFFYYTWVNDFALFCMRVKHGYFT